MSSSEQVGGERPGPSNSSGEAKEFIKLKVKGHEGDEIHFRLKMTTPFSKIKKNYAERVGAAAGSVRLIFDGTPVSDTDTPRGLSLEDDDIIDAFVEQTGGGGGRRRPWPSDCPQHRAHPLRPSTSLPLGVRRTTSTRRPSSPLHILCFRQHGMQHGKQRHAYAVGGLVTWSPCESHAEKSWATHNSKRKQNRHQSTVRRSDEAAVCSVHNLCASGGVHRVFVRRACLSVRM